MLLRGVNDNEIDFEDDNSDTDVTLIAGHHMGNIDIGWNFIDSIIENNTFIDLIQLHSIYIDYHKT